jgi:hypothetical protein
MHSQQAALLFASVYSTRSSLLSSWVSPLSKSPVPGHSCWEKEVKVLTVTDMEMFTPIQGNTVICNLSRLSGFDINLLLIGKILVENYSNHKWLFFIHCSLVFTTKTNSVALVRDRTIPTERPPLVGKVSANLLRIEGNSWTAWRIPTAVFSDFWTGAATFSFK